MAAELTDAIRLQIYDKLREAHKSIKAIYNEDLYELAVNADADSIVCAIDTVNGVLYLAEGEVVHDMECMEVPKNG